MSRAAPQWKAISVKQPYAHLIVAGCKRYEARSYPIEPGAVLIHASQSAVSGWRHDDAVVRALAASGVSDADILPRGAIVGVVNIVKVIEPGDHDRLPEKHRRLCTEDGITDDYYLHELSAPAFTPPVPCHGHLKVWPVPASVLDALNGRHTYVPVQRRRAM